MPTEELLQDEILALQQKKLDAMRTCTSPYAVEVLGKIIRVLPKVFYPATDTRLLITTVKVEPHERVLEPFAGTGVIALFLAPYAREVIATDINPEAVKNIQENINLHGLKEKMLAVQADIFPDGEEMFDVIVLNPPYTDREAQDMAEKALWDENHMSVKRFFREAKKYLKPKGRIYSTWSNFADFAFIERLGRTYGYSLKPVAETTKDKKVYRVYQFTLGSNEKATGGI